MTRPDFDLAAVTASARRSMRKERRFGAVRMIQEPDRIEAALRPDLFGPVPVSVAARLERCEARLACEQELGRAGHYAYSAVRLVALRQALLALRWQRRFGEAVEVVPVDEVEAA